MQHWSVSINADYQVSQVKDKDDKDDWLYSPEHYEALGLQQE